MPLSRQTVILLDDALSVAQSANETRVDTDHALQVLAESSMSTSGILRQYGVTPKAIQDARASGKIVRKDSTARDVVAVTKAGDARPVYFREALLRDMMNILSQSVNRHVILVGPDGVGKRTLVYSLGVLMGEGKGPTRLKSLVTLDETALLDNDLNAVRAGLAKAGDGILFVPHLHRFFGGPAKAEFNKATATLQKAFLSDNPVIIGTTTEQEYNGRLLTVSSIAENSQMLRVPEPSLDEAIAMLTVSKATFESDYGLEIDDEAIRLAVTLAKRYMSALPLPRSAEHLMHRTAAMVNMSKQSHLAFRPEPGRYAPRRRGRDAGGQSGDGCAGQQAGRGRAQPLRQHGRAHQGAHRRAGSSRNRRQPRDQGGARRPQRSQASDRVILVPRPHRCWQNRAWQRHWPSSCSAASRPCCRWICPSSRTRAASTVCSGRHPATSTAKPAASSPSASRNSRTCWCCSTRSRKRTCRSWTSCCK
ncbi:MAG: ATP-dependent Clp protease ATP-binding subunit [Chloroflexi bacterium]|nr:ATP-dependent Clp protease ATP-binding subunit [Chloroflexota bacterium]